MDAMCLSKCTDLICIARALLNRLMAAAVKEGKETENPSHEAHESHQSAQDSNLSIFVCDAWPSVPDVFGLTKGVGRRAQVDAESQSCHLSFTGIKSKRSESKATQKQEAAAARYTSTP